MEKIKDIMKEDYEQRRREEGKKEGEGKRGFQRRLGSEGFTQALASAAGVGLSTHDQKHFVPA